VFVFLLSVEFRKCGNRFNYLFPKAYYHFGCFVDCFQSNFKWDKFGVPVKPDFF